MGVYSELNPAVVKAARTAAFLERQDEIELARAWRNKGDTAALHALSQAHMRLVIAVAARFHYYGLPLADLVQEGHVGLLEAAARFDPDREVRFSTYATWWIRASIQDFVLRNWSIVRGGTSSAQKALFFNLRRLRAKLARDETMSDSDAYETIAKSVGVSRADVEAMDARLSKRDASLNAPAVDDAEGASEKMDFLVDEGPLPDETVGGAIDADRHARWLREALAVLNPREFEIVQQRHLSDQAATLDTLGAHLHISKERVRQIEARALKKVQAELARKGNVLH